MRLGVRLAAIEDIGRRGARRRCHSLSRDYNLAERGTGKVPRNLGGGPFRKSKISKAESKLHTSFLRTSNMPKLARHKRNGSATTPFAGVTKSRPAKSSKAGHSIFKFNTDIGQHILKNPGVAQAIVEKADLRQSDVLESSHSLYTAKTNT